MNKYKFKIDGIHCAACEILIERELKNLKEIDSIVYENEFVTIVSKDMSEEEMRTLVNKTLEQHGYNISNDFVSKTTNYKSWFDAILITISVVAIYIIIREALKIDFSFSTNTVDYVGVFIIGILASISTCMAVVGGIVLSISSNSANTGSRLPIFSFHISRLVSFLVLGGVLGAIGAVLLPTLIVQSIIDIILFVVFIVLGLNLLGIKTFRFGLVKKLGVGSVTTIENSSKQINSLTAIFLGAVTFFLPCGFTQTAQVTSIASGNMVTGALVMFVFALGTLPALAAISFVSVKLSSPTFYKAAGLIVISFAIMNLVLNFDKIKIGLGL